jgi:tetratricopeptide (TPR) repeat protein
VGFLEAVKEFHRELELNPNDFFSLAQLGYVAFSERRFGDAEEYLKRAASLDPRNPDDPLLLGQVYIQLDRPTDGELALRKAIALTTDLSRNHYQVQRAHYLLGRLLVQTRHIDEAKQEMQISADLLKKNLLRDQARLKGAPIQEATGIAPFERALDQSSMNVKAKQELDIFAARAAPALADSYNNLGAIAAGANKFATATGYFEKAAKWNPSLEGLDYNWGRSAFSAQLYAQAIPPLSRYLAAHPQEQGARRVLGVSYFMLKDYAAVVRTLDPIEPSLAATPQLATMYAQSLALTSSEKKGANARP